jgi:flagellar hook-associated protein 3 FlgL
MKPISLGDMAQTFMLRRMSGSLKQDARVAAQELTSGQSANISQRLRGDFSHLSGLEGSLTKLNGYRAATDRAALTTNAMQTTLRYIDSLTDDIGINLLGAGTAADVGTMSSTINDASQRFDAVIRALNTKLGDSTLFAGVASDGPAIASSDVILTALETAIYDAGAVTAPDIEAAVTAWFDAPAGFASVGYLGGQSLSSLAISPEDKVDLSITAADPALRDTLKALALAALVGRETSIPDAATGMDLTRRAGTALLQSQSDRALLAGRLGLSEARIDQAQTRNQAEGFTLQLARADLLAIDPYEAATRMEAAQNQLETLYSVTARLSRLSLVDFLR